MANTNCGCRCEKPDQEPVLVPARWRIQVYLTTFNKLEYEVGYKHEAHEYATKILERGCKIVDERGVETYFPARLVDKVKVIPPGVSTGVTSQRFL